MKSQAKTASPLKSEKPKASSVAESVALLTASQREIALRQLAPTATDAAGLLHEWRFWARPTQLAPADPWTIWLQLAGRGFGKTRSGAEWIYERWRQGHARRIALIAPTPADARDVMIEGESGILHVGYPQERPLYEPSKRRLTWPRDREAEPATATIFSGYEPEQLRGPQHDTAWGDELAIWAYPREAFDNLMLGLRLGENPKAVFTTTPKPIALLRELVRRRDVQVTRGSTYENIQNLAPAFRDEIITLYEGTTLGQQELHAVLLEESEGALWKRAMFRRVPEVPQLLRIVVAIDPAVTAREESDETGIVVAGRGWDGNGYVLADRSGRYGPDQWARRAIEAFDLHQADRIVYEANQGGDLVAHTLTTVRKNLPVEAVHATVSKRARAEPIAALYEQGRVYHVGAFEALEDQLCSWEPLSGMASPDRLDALVWALSALFSTPDVVPAELDPSFVTDFHRESPWKGHF